MSEQADLAEPQPPAAIHDRKEDLRQLFERAQRDGWTKGLAYRVTAMLREGEPDRRLVCVLCGWYWAGLNHCVNPACQGFCSWGERYHGEPSSWVRTIAGWRPRMPGESSPSHPRC